MRNTMKFDIALVVGGMFQVLMRVAPSVFGARQILHIDAKNEIDKCARPLVPDKRAITYEVPLGEGQTSATIIKTRGLADHHLPVASCSEGLAQNRLLGRATFWNDIRRYRELLKTKVVPEMAKRLRGTISGVRTIAMSSLSGGSGSGTHPDAANELHTEIFSDFDTTISHISIYAGPITHYGLGETGKNSGAAIAELIAANSPNDRVAYTHVLVDFANEIHDVQLREQKTGFFVESFLSGELQDNIKVWIPNEARRDRYGNFICVRMSDFRPLADVAGHVAAHWEKVCSQLLKPTVNLSVLSPLELVNKSRALSRETEESIESRALDLDLMELFEAIEQPGTALRVFCLAHGTDRHYDLGEIQNGLGPIRYTIESLKVRLSLLETAKQRLRVKRNQVLSDAKRAEADLEYARAQTEKKHRTLVQGSWWFLSTPLLEGDVRKHRAAYDEYRQQVAHLMAIEEAQTAVEKELNSRLGDVTKLHARLNAIADPAALKTSRYIEAADIDDYLPDLVLLARGGEIDRLFHLLGTACASVTLEGLAAIVGSHEASAEGIAQAIKEETHADVGPWWGGVPHAKSVYSYIVLPPLDPSHRSMIAQAAREIGLKGVLMGDSCKFGPMVTKLDINPAALTDIMPQIAIHGAREAIADPKSSYYVEDIAKTQAIVDQVESERASHRNGSSV